MPFLLDTARSAQEAAPTLQARNSARKEVQFPILCVWLRDCAPLNVIKHPRSGIHSQIPKFGSSERSYQEPNPLRTLPLKVSVLMILQYHSMNLYKNLTSITLYSLVASRNFFFGSRLVFLSSSSSSKEILLPYHLHGFNFYSSLLQGRDS